MVEAGVKNQSRGQIVAATLAIIVSLGGIILLATGHNIAGLVALLPNLVGLVGLFLYNSAKNFSGG